MQYKFTDKEVKELKNKMVVLMDTREQENQHIISWFDKNKKAYERQTLDYGDYSCFLPKGTFKGQVRDIYFTDQLVIERKFCIDELAMNLKSNKTNINEIKPEIIDLLGLKYLEKVLKTDYSRLKQEFTSMNRKNIEFYIFLEDENLDRNIRTSSGFRAQYDPKTLYARLKGLEREFHTIIRPVSKEFIASEIYNYLWFGLRNIFVHMGYIDELSLEELEVEK